MARALWWNTVRVRRWLLAGCCAWWVVLHGGPSNSTAQPPGEISASQREWQVKYAFLYSFGLLTKWPETAFQTTSDRFVIVVAGTTPFGADLDRIAQTKKIGGRQVVIVRLATDVPLPACQVLFVPKSVQPAQEERLVADSKGRPVLLVGERSGFGDQRGAVRFYVDVDTVKFELNPRAAEERQLALDPRLLKLGKLVGTSHATTPTTSEGAHASSASANSVP